MTRAVVVGAQGLLGRALTRALRARLGEAQVRALDHGALDVTDPDCAQSPLLDGAQVVFNCAAYTHVDRAEDEAAAAFAVNRDGVMHLARAARERDALLVHVSTDFVFDGRSQRPYRPDDRPAPLSAYGWSKWAGEEALFASKARYLLVRTAWLFGLSGRNFVDTILRRAAAGERLQVVCDQTGSPTYAADLATALVDLWQRRCTGAYHCTNRGAATWHEFACEIVRRAGLDAPVGPVTTDAYPRPARRPRYAVLDCSATEQALGRPMRMWQAALADCLSRRGTADRPKGDTAPCAHS